MASLVKKGFQLGQAVYATGKEMYDQQKQKPPQHPQGGYYQGQHGAPSGSYGHVGIPGQHTSSGQQHPPLLPPRPNTHTPVAQGYGSSSQQSHGHPPQGYHATPPPGMQDPPHNQSTYTQQSVPIYGQNGQSIPYGAQAPNSPHGGQYAPPHVAHQTTGSIPSGHQQPIWNPHGAMPTPPSDKPALSAWEIAGGARPPQPASVPPPQSWTPASPPPAPVSPLNAHDPYSPPTPSHAPPQPFPQQHAPVSSQPTGMQSQYHPTDPPAHAPTPPMSPPLPSPPIAHQYGQAQQYSPMSPVIPPAVNQNPYSYGNQGLTSPTPPSAYPAYHAPAMQNTSPPTQVQSPVSPTGAQPTSSMPHPPAFVSELPAFSEPKPQAEASFQRPPPSKFIAAPVPMGYAELPAELPSKHTTKPSGTSVASTPPTIPAAAVTQSTGVEQPKPLHIPPQHDNQPQNVSAQASPPPAAYAPQSYTPAQPTQSPATANNYQPYHPTPPPSNIQHAPQQGPSPAPQQSGDAHGGYKPYAPPSQQVPGQYTAMPAEGPPAQSPGVPQRMGSLASKFSTMGINTPPTPQQGQYAPYPGSPPPHQ